MTVLRLVLATWALVLLTLALVWAYIALTSPPRVHTEGGVTCGYMLTALNCFPAWYLIEPVGTEG